MSGGALAEQSSPREFGDSRPRAESFLCRLGLRNEEEEEAGGDGHVAAIRATTQKCFHVN